MDGWMGGWIQRCMDGWVSGRTDIWMNEQMDDGQIHRRSQIELESLITYLLFNDGFRIST